jgi:hypothetical protein
VLTAKEGTNFYKALRYIEPAIGLTSYKWWHSGIIPDGPPSYAKNAPAPDIDIIIHNGIFCAGVANVMLRRVGKRVPFALSHGPGAYDGGTGAYWGGSWGKGYFDGYAERFNLEKAKGWAREDRSGVLIGRGYKNAKHDQGHVAILLPSGYVLQSIPMGPGSHAGLNWGWTIEQSHDGGYYEYMVRSNDWIDYEGDEFD